MLEGAGNRAQVSLYHTLANARANGHARPMSRSQVHGRQSSGLPACLHVLGKPRARMQAVLDLSVAVTLSR